MKTDLVIEICNKIILEFEDNNVLRAEGLVYELLEAALKEFEEKIEKEKELEEKEIIKEIIKEEKIYVLDLETTGLEPFPDSKLLQLSLVAVDVKKLSYELVLDVFFNPAGVSDDDLKECFVIKHDFLSIDEIRSGGVDRLKIWGAIKYILNTLAWTSYNTEFDYDRFLKKMGIRKPAFCIMKMATDICRIPGPYGWKYPKLAEAYKLLVKKANASSTYYMHNAASDAIAAAKVLIEIIKIKKNEKTDGEEIDVYS